MNIDIIGFWDRFDESLKMDGRRLKELCESLNISYGTITQNRSQTKFPNLENAASLCKALNASLDVWVYGVKPLENVNPEARAVERSPRLQRIISFLQKAPEKLDALETFLDIKHIPAGGGSTHKLLKAQM
ncbi:hypothetical protein SDC9_109065 [bioreactor metagenome]|uniref:HTH cro/C1-type domain-containing protein n=1 Tax=bioreactor metagenome TaxID=1076179 RepID=A0A645B9P2_9ZZZZ